MIRVRPYKQLLGVQQRYELVTFLMMMVLVRSLIRSADWLDGAERRCMLPVLSQDSLRVARPKGPLSRG